MAAKQFKAMKVKIRRNPKGGFLYPDFEQLGVVSSSGIPVKSGEKKWSKYIDIYGLGISYDHVSSINTESVDSPFGTWFAVIICDSTFIDQALALYPDDCTALDDAGAANFWDTKVTPYEPKERVDIDIVNGISAKIAAGIALTADDNNALDPSNDIKGIRKNHKKSFADYKARLNFEIIT